MMKKWLAIFLLLTLCLSASAQGVRVEFGGAFSLIRPDELEFIELSEDEAGEGMVYCAQSEELEMYVWACDMDGLTREELYGMWQEDDFLEKVSLRELGDDSYLVYEIEGEMAGAIVACQEGIYYEIALYYQTEEAMEMARQVLSSMEKI